jgi:cytochrome c peroxidase
MAGRRSSLARSRASAALCGLALAACRAGEVEHLETLAAQGEPIPAAAVASPSTAPSAARRSLSSGGRFEVEWTAEPGIAFDVPFELACEVRSAEGGAPVDGVQLQFTGWMPSHQHGMARESRTEALGGGRYRVRGLLFHMEGHWQLFADLGFEGTFERATFDIVLAPEEAAAAVAEFDAGEVSRVLAMSPLPEPPDDPTNAYDLDERAARLGQYLFFDERLSGSGARSCATCHVPERGWSDGRPLARAEGELTRRTMSLWNVAQQRWFFWDGRADSLWSQALQPLEEPREMAGDRAAIARVVATDADLRRAYGEVFGSAPSSDAELDSGAVDRVFANVGKALAAFERRIVSSDSPFDRFVEGLRGGDPQLVSELAPDARRGLKLFLGRANCHACHAGPNFTDREFHSNRVPARAELPLDLGRFDGVMRLQSDPFNGVGRFSDAPDGEARAKLEHLPVTGHVWGEFRTPTLRSVALGGPYMHQGQLDTLERVVQFYSDEIPPSLGHGGETVLKPLSLSPQEKADLVAFLRSLTGAPLPDELLRQPPKPYLE